MSRRRLDGSVPERKPWRRSRICSTKRKTFLLMTANTEARLARLTRLIEQYRETQQRQLLERAIQLWRRAEANRQFVDLVESPPERLH